MSDAKRLREFEGRNLRLKKKLIAEPELEKAMLKDLFGRKW